MIKEDYRPIIEGQAGIMIQSVSVAKECAIELIEKKKIDDKLQLKLYKLLSLQSLLKHDSVGDSYNLVSSLMADCLDGHELDYLSYILFNALRNEAEKLKLSNFASFLAALQGLK